MPARKLTSLLCAVVLFMLASCGPGEGGSGGAQPSSPIVVGAGRVDGFGSTIVEGQRFNDSQAQVLVDENPEAPTPVQLSAIKLGSQVAIQASRDVLEKATVSPVVIGPIESVAADGSSISVLGQRVIVTGHPVISPIIDGFGSNASVADGYEERYVLDGFGSTFVLGDRVEVHGTKLSNGAILATRLERLPTSGSVVRFTGKVRSIDRAAMEFSVGSVRVSYAQARLVSSEALTPVDAQALNDEQNVVIYSAEPGAAYKSVLPAQVIRIEKPPAALPLGASFAFAGPASHPNPTSVVVQGLQIDISNAVFAPGQSAADLVSDAIVRTGGVVEAGGVLRAKNVTVIKRPEDAPISLTGPVTESYRVWATFRIRGATVRATPETIFVGTTSRYIVPRAPASVRGLISSGVLVAQRIEVLPPPLDVLSDIVGTISNYRSTTGEFNLSPQTVTLRVTSATVYADGGVSDVADGRPVVASGVLTSNGFEVQTLFFLDIVGNFGTTLSIGIVDKVFCTGCFASYMDLTPTTVFTGGPTGTAEDLRLVKNSYAEIRATGSGSTGNTKIPILSVNFRIGLNETNSFYGAVTDYVSVSNFRVWGRQVDASNATFVGTAAPLPAKQLVLVTGALDRDVFRATRVERIRN